MKGKIVLSLLGLLGIVLILISTSRYGVGLSPDSVRYISVARNLVAGQGPVTFEGTPRILQPPLYPLILAAGSVILKTDALWLARFLNALLFGLTIYLTGRLFLCYGLTIGHATLCFLLLSTWPMIKIAVMAWSEPLFVCEMLLFLFWAARWWNGRKTTSLILMALVAALAGITRYLGVSLVLGGMGLILLGSIPKMRTKITSLALFLFLSMIPLSVWITRNQILAGTLFGERAKSSYSLLDNLLFLFDGFIFWFLPDGVPDRAWLTVGVTMILILLCAGAFIYIRNQATEKERRRFVQSLFQLMPVLLSAGSYTMILLVTSSLSSYDRIGTRLLSPVYIPAGLVIVIIMTQAISIASRLAPTQWIRAFIKTTIIILGLLSAGMILAVAAYRLQVGAGGYASASWQNSPTIRYLQEQEAFADTLLYSNAPDAVYILAARQAHMSPAKPMDNRPDSSQVQLRGDWLQTGGAILVWFKPIQQRGYLYSIDELTAVVDLALLMHFADADIYRVTAKK